MCGSIDGQIIEVDLRNIRYVLCNHDYFDTLSIIIGGRWILYYNWVPFKLQGSIANCDDII